MKKIFTYLTVAACMACGTTVAQAVSFDKALAKKSISLSFDSSRLMTERNASKKTQASTNQLIKKADTSKIDVKVISAQKVKSNAPVQGSSMTGEWVFTLGDYYFGELAGDYMSVEYTFDATYYDEDGWVVFEDPAQYVEPFVGELDEATGKLTFQRGYLGSFNSYSGTMYIYQQPFVYDWGYGDIIPQDIVATYDQTAGTLTFQPDNGMSWEVYNDQAGTDLAGYYDIFDLEGAVKDQPYEDNPNEWTNIGNALFMDGWVLPGFGVDQTLEENWYEVPMQQNSTNKNLYRLVNPYQVGPAVEFNETREDGYIMIDITNPNAVLINEAALSAGFANSSVGISKFYPYNTVIFYSRYLGYSPQEVITYFGDEIIITKYENGVINLGSYNDPQYGLIYDANFGYQADKDGGYGWQSNSTDASLNMTTRITFPGYFESNSVNGIITDNNATPVYYNINGIRVDNPVEGGLYIVKKGSEVTKVIK